MSMNQQLIEQTENETQALSIAEQARTRGTIEASLTVAAARPRNEQQAIARLMTSCQRVRLAESACYTYSKGGTDITGPSITLVVQVALAWGNLDWGYRELSRGHGESTVEAYAWDQQTNARYSRTFVVPHRIRVGGRQRQLREDELADWIANQAQRRVRTCLENVIPRDVIDEAVDECAKTLKANIDLDSAKIMQMVGKFAELGVSQEQLSAKLQRNVDAIQPAQYLALRRVYVAIQDGLQTVKQAFPEVDEPAPSNADRGADLMLKAKAKAQKGPKGTTGPQSDQTGPKGTTKGDQKGPKPEKKKRVRKTKAQIKEAVGLEGPEQVVIDAYAKAVRDAGTIGELNIIADQIAYDAQMGALPSPQADKISRTISEKIANIEAQQ